jgi:hypothetical protein
MTSTQSYTRTDWSHPGYAGTSFQGMLYTSYAQLLARFGLPGEGDGEKVQAEWIFVDDHGQVATIYDYKERQPVASVSAWHVGARDKATATAAYRYFTQQLNGRSTCEWCGEPGNDEQGPVLDGYHDDCRTSSEHGALATQLRARSPR